MFTKKSIYNPQLFLASLGNGGLAISFYMYLMFMVNHPDTPMVTYNHLVPVLTAANKYIAILAALAMGGILYFGFRHFRLLFWNIREYIQFRKSEDYKNLLNSKNKISLMTIPLTLAMSVNVLFVSGATFVPNLWNIVEYLFPFAIIAFWAIGIYALKIFFDYISGYIQEGGFQAEETNSLNTLIVSFALAMVGVGLAAPAAMSHNLQISIFAFISSLFFNIIALGYFFIKFGHGIRGILNKGIHRESAHSIWIIIPILTLLGITTVRLTAAVSHNLIHTSVPAYIIFIILGIFIAIQLFFAILGGRVLQANNYFADFLHGKAKNPGAYGLICPGVAGFVLGMFFLGWGLVKTGVVDKFSLTYFVLLLPLVILQMKTIFTINKLNRKFFSKEKIGIEANHNVA